MKRILSLVLVLCVLLALSLPVFAAQNTAYADALNKLGLFLGTNNGYELDSKMTREQGVVMIIRLLGKEKTALSENNAHPFLDTKNYAWVDPYLGYAYKNGITKGISETAFGYGNTMSDAMFLTMLLRVLGYKDANDGTGDFVWDDPYTLAMNVDLSDGQARDEFLRDDMVRVCWNALSAQRADDELPSIAQELILSAVIRSEDYIAAEALIPASESGSGSGYSGGSFGGRSSQQAAKPVEPSIVLGNNTLRLTPKSSDTISAKVTGISGDVTWTSDNPAVASVDSNGTVTALKEGIAVITAKIGSLVATCRVTVAAEIVEDKNATPWIPIG